jgi:hypothetical protein
MIFRGHVRCGILRFGCGKWLNYRLERQPGAIAFGRDTVDWPALQRLAASTMAGPIIAGSRVTAQLRQDIA